jgi:hypothetical protein
MRFRIYLPFYKFVPENVDAYLDITNAPFGDPGKNSLCQTALLGVLIDAAEQQPLSPFSVDVAHPIAEYLDFCPDDSAKMDKPCLGTP